MQIVERDPKDGLKWASLYSVSRILENSREFLGVRKLNRHRTGSGSTSTVEPDPRILKNSTV